MQTLEQLCKWLFFSFILVHTFVRSYFLCLFDLSVTSASWLASKFFLFFNLDTFSFLQGVHEILWVFSRVFNILFKNFQYFATSPSPAQGCHWLYRKWHANKSDCTLKSQMRWVALLHAGDMGCSELGKHTIFNEHPVLRKKQYI